MMGTIAAAEYVSVDGVMQDPGGVGEIEGGGWSSACWNDELAESQAELLFASDALMLGRVTYQGFAAAWPDMEHEEGDFAAKMNSMPKFVASRTLGNWEWNASPLAGDVLEAVTKLKRDTDQNFLIYGSGSIVRLLLEHDQLDLIRLMVHPVVVGAGKPLFTGDVRRKPLRLVESQATKTGVAILDYNPAGEDH
jgi:dihydrofolate reductase